MQARVSESRISSLIAPVKANLSPTLWSSNLGHKIPGVSKSSKSEEVLSEIAVNRGFKLKGNELDLKRAADILIDEFRAAKLGRMTLESVENVLED